MSEPITISIPLDELRNWQNKIKSVMPPLVKFGDPDEMQREAYEARGDILYYLNHRIASMPGFSNQ